MKDALAGTWLGHALHPMLTDVVIGTFLSATLLDVVGGDEDGEAGARLIGIGMAAYLPTALSGVNDWADTEPVDDGIRRAGLVHAWSNATALALYALSLKARRNGNRGRARALSVAGATRARRRRLPRRPPHVRQGRRPGPDRVRPGPGRVDGGGAELPDGRPTRVVVDDTPVLLVRADGSLYALHDRCSHRGCSLADGELDGLEVVCACHGSRFDLRDGSVKQGPATAPQPAFETRERDGQDRNSPHRLTRSGRLPWMAVRGVEDTQTVEHQAALLRVALLVARDAPQEELFQAAAEETARLFGAESGSVVRYVGAERAVIVGVWRTRGRRGLPVNAEVDFEPGTTAMGQARATRRPVRVAGYEQPPRPAARRCMRSIGLKAGVAAPVLRRGDVWGALVAGAADEETLPPGCEQRLAGLAELVGQALDNDDRRAELAASRTRLVQAGDEARRRLERSLHEGAHQHVVALALKLRVALGRAEPDSEIADVLRELLADAMETSAELSELARGLHPAVLTERGLAAALQALTARCSVPVSMQRAARPPLRRLRRDDRVPDGRRGAHQRRARTRTRPSARCWPPTAATGSTSRSATTASAAPRRAPAAGSSAWPTARTRSAPASRSSRCGDGRRRVEIPDAYGSRSPSHADAT